MFKQALYTRAHNDVVRKTYAVQLEPVVVQQVVKSIVGPQVQGAFHLFMTLPVFIVIPLQKPLNRGQDSFLWPAITIRGFRLRSKKILIQVCDKGPITPGMLVRTQWPKYAIRHTVEDVGLQIGHNLIELT